MCSRNIKAVTVCWRFAGVLGLLSQFLDGLSLMHKTLPRPRDGGLVLDSEKLPVSRFSTRELPGTDSFEAWRQSIGVMFEAQIFPGREPSADFHAEVEAYHLGDLVFGTAVLDAQHLCRGARRIHADQLDHVLLQVYRSGGQRGDFAGTPFCVEPGELFVLDLTRSFDTLASRAHITNLVVPRECLESRRPLRDIHGRILRGGLGSLFGDYLNALEQRLPQLHLDEAGDVARATVDLLDACLNPSLDSFEQARQPIEAGQLNRIKGAIEQALADPGLSPQWLCRQLGLSRSRLYRLFEPLGGVAAYIRQRRLERIHGQLCQPHEQRHIGVIAYQWGFADEAHFSRAFRHHFGYSPSEARELRWASSGRGTRATQVDAAGYEQWIRQLGS